VSNSIRRTIEQQEAMRRLGDSLGEAYRQLGIGSDTLRFLRDEEERRKLLSSLYQKGAFAQVVEDAERHRKLIEGPLERLCCINLGRA
jgi:hypothetical protein